MKPWLGVAQASIHIYGSTSLKDRRHVVRSLLDRTKLHMNVSSADLGPQEAYERADLAFSCVSSSHTEANDRMESLCSFLDKQAQNGEFEVLAVSYEVFAYGDVSH